MHCFRLSLHLKLAVMTPFSMPEPSSSVTLVASLNWGSLYPSPARAERVTLFPLASAYTTKIWSRSQLWVMAWMRFSLTNVGADHRGALAESDPLLGRRACDLQEDVARATARAGFRNIDPVADGAALGTE